MNQTRMLPRIQFKSRLSTFAETSNGNHACANPVENNCDIRTSPELDSTGTKGTRPRSSAKIERVSSHPLEWDERRKGAGRAARQGAHCDEA